MPEWIVEKGIGETRAALVEGRRIVEARIELDGTVPAGTILQARLVQVGNGGRNGIARDESSADYLLPHVPRDITEGAALNIEVTRPALSGPEPWKRPLAKATRDERRRPQSLAERLRSTGHPVRKLAFPAPRDELAELGWNELIDEGRTGAVQFPGGSLGLFFTPAMTLIDVDGTRPASELAIAGARAAAEAIQRLDIGGSIGIDLPTARGKEARSAAAEAIDEVLPQPFERTAVNGFGFLQIVRPRSRASLLELAQDRATFEARAFLRRVAFDAPGPKRLVANPGIIAALEARPEWIGELAKQIGGVVTLRADAALPIHGSYAEKS
ncbi:MAG TPA: ribonuclease [Sphingomicrobium sp.]|nr:ribonuclease [Sphingomicrobium sp.]